MKKIVIEIPDEIAALCEQTHSDIESWLKKVITEDANKQKIYLVKRDAEDAVVRHKPEEVVTTKEEVEEVAVAPA